MRWLRALLGLVGFVTAPFAIGMDLVSVEQVQSPAWIERAQQRLPLIPGDQIVEGDRILSGPVGRVVLTTAGGGRLKLGENAALLVEGIALIDELGSESAVFSGRFRVLQGAFTYTDSASDAPIRQDIRFHLGGISVDVIGTEIWGRSDVIRAQVCLIEGHLRVKSVHETAWLSRPLSVYSQAHGDKPAPVQRATPAQIREWVRTTELEPGEGVAKIGGAWRAHLASVNRRDSAQALRERLRDEGFPVELQQTTVDGQGVWRIILPGLGSSADAAAIGERIARLYQLDRPWVSRR